LNIYDKAINIIEEHGWWTAHTGRRQGRETCLLLALHEADPSLNIRTAHRHLGIPDGDFSSIIAWNDTPGRTADDVIAKLKLASETYELEQEAARA
jgi:hypothetical protein